MCANELWGTTLCRGGLGGSVCYTQQVEDGDLTGGEGTKRESYNRRFCLARRGSVGDDANGVKGLQGLWSVDSGHEGMIKRMTDRQI